MAERRASFREIEHTADLGIEVTASDLASLFACAGETLFGLIVDAKTIDIRDSIVISVTGSGPEELLHSWLCELLARFNVDGFIARSCEIQEITRDRVEGTICGEKLDLSRHGFRTEIKGVTYHDFRVWEEDGFWHARLIFDV